MRVKVRSLLADDKQGVCGFCAGESDTAFLLCELHQLMRGGARKGKRARRDVRYRELG